MPRTCTVCLHPQKPEIDSALLSGQPFRNVALRFGTSSSALFRHRNDHIPVALAKAHEAKEIEHGDDLFSQVRSLNDKTMRILLQAEAAGDPRTALMAVREARGNSELLCKMLVAAQSAEKQGEPEEVRVARLLDKLRRLSAAVGSGEETLGE